MPIKPTRREFLGLSLAAAGTTVPRQERTPPPEELPTAPPIENVRIGMVGVGGQGGAHVRNFLGIEGCEIAAICDIDSERADAVAGWVQESGQAKPRTYARGDTDYERLCAEEDLDLIFTATPWRWHVPVCISAMLNGKHAATEVPAAVSIEECWSLVETAEQTQKHCVMMENVNYGRQELMVFNMVRQGLLGELIHGEGGYLHDLREIKFAKHGEGMWRREHSKYRNGNLYPTHGLGPIAQCMDINRGDRFQTLVSMSSNARGLARYAATKFAPDTPERRETYRLGDVNTSIIQTALGRTITVVHDTNLPRPYSRIHNLQGTKGLFHGYPHRVHIEGRSPEHEWEDAADYLAEYDHPLWRALESVATGAGHGGMDYIEDYRLIESLRKGTSTDMNVYDGAALSAVSGLSEMSVARGGTSVPFPDFTRGRWEQFRKLEIAQA